MILHYIVYQYTEQNYFISSWLFNQKGRVIKKISTESQTINVAYILIAVIRLRADYPLYLYCSAHNNWWIYPVLGQFLGGVIGGLSYELTIGIHHELDEGIEEGYSAAPTKDEPLGPSGSGGNSPRVTK